MNITPVVLSVAVLASTALAADTPAKPPLPVPRITYLNKTITWQADYAQGLDQARREKKLVLVDFYTTWCGQCKQLDQDVYSKSEVAERLRQNFVTIKVNAEAQANKKLCQKFRVNSYPTTLFLDGTERIIHQSSGYLTIDEFLKLVDVVSSRRR